VDLSGSALNNTATAPQNGLRMYDNDDAPETINPELLDGRFAGNNGADHRSHFISPANLTPWSST
jgi:hypothetical protein